jgi:hypothetical protein
MQAADRHPCGRLPGIVRLRPSAGYGCLCVRVVDFPDAPARFGRGLWFNCRVSGGTRIERERVRCARSNGQDSRRPPGGCAGMSLRGSRSSGAIFAAVGLRAIMFAAGSDAVRIKRKALALWLFAAIRAPGLRQRSLTAGGSASAGGLEIAAGPFACGDLLGWRHARERCVSGPCY